MSVTERRIGIVGVSSTDADGSFDASPREVSNRLDQPAHGRVVADVSAGTITAVRARSLLRSITCSSAIRVLCS